MCLKDGNILFWILVLQTCGLDEHAFGLLCLHEAPIYY